MASGAARPVLVASNRGPFVYQEQDGALVAARGSGGLAAALGDVVRSVGGRWIAAAISEADHRRAEGAPAGWTEEGLDLQYLELDPQTFDAYYNGISNRVLWFCHHALWDAPYEPAFGAETVAAWDGYRSVNQRFADALLAAPNAAEAAFLVQDYHLCLVPAMLRARGATAISHFTHIPFAGPVHFAMLPDGMRTELLTGMLGADVVGFHAAAWARNFLEACRGLEGAGVDARRRRVRWEGREVRVEVNPLSIDAGALRALAARDEARQHRSRVRRPADEMLIVRADRMELSKNIVRGFAAFERMLELEPDWRGRVRFVAHVYPSREALEEYAVYARRCEEAAAHVNERFAYAGWTPVELVVRDDFDEVLATYAEYDVLLVNPIFDGLNLVAKEGPVVNGRDGVVVLSRNAGAHEELGRYVLGINPFDVEGTAQALLAALAMPAAERRRRARGLRRSVRRHTPRDWALAQLAALEA
jgi:trehalose 6-phosphate synthase